MAATSTKDILESTKATPAGKGASESMPLGTDVDTNTPTLRTIAENLVALELDLQEAVKNGYRWQSLRLKSKGGANMVAIVLYHPKHSIDVEKTPSGTVFTVDSAPASVVATSRK